MESNWLTNNRKTIGRVLLLAGLLLLLYSVRRNLLNTLTPFFYSAVFAFLLNPLINWLQEKGVRRGWSAFITVTLIFLLLVFLMVLFIPSLVSDASMMLRSLTGGMQNILRLAEGASAWLTDALDGAVDVNAEIRQLYARGTRLMSDALTAFAGSLGGLIDVLIIPVIAFYMLKDKDLILRELLNLFPERLKPRMSEMGTVSRRLLSGYVQGKIIITFFVGLFTGLGCLAMGLPNALTIGIIAALFDLIPYFGPWLAGILPVLIALMSPTPFKAVWVVALIMVIQQLEANFITPRIISERVGLHPLLVMFSVMFFGATMGIPGMVVGVPLTAVILALFNLSRQHLAQAAKAEETAREETPASSPSTPETTEDKT